MNKFNKRQISFGFGNKKYKLAVPETLSVQITEPGKVKKSDNIRETIKEALDFPIGSFPIEDMVKPGQRICIISDDITRMTPVREILEDLLPRLEKSGVAKEDITIVMALGSHRKMTDDEMIKKVGKNMFSSYKVVNSEFWDENYLTEVGKSQLGTPIKVFKTAIDADIRIGIGSIVPHGCMGWSGGAKILYPGITSEDIVSEFHVMQGLEKNVLFGMVECPVRLAVEEWTEKIGLHFIINTVLTEELELYKAVAGHFVKAHRAGVVFGKEAYGASVREQPDIAIVSSYPLNVDFWQCTKALYGAGSILADGGTIILIAPCSEGIGPHKDICKYIQMIDGEKALKEKIALGETGDELLAMAVGVSLGKMSNSCRICIVSDGLTKEEIKESGYELYGEKNLQESFEKVLTRYNNPKILIIPAGGETVPFMVK